MSINPFTVVVQQHKLTFNFRVNDSFWHTSDVEHLLRDMEKIFKARWYVEHCVRRESEIDVYVNRTCSAWRAFCEPYPVMR